MAVAAKCLEATLSLTGEDEAERIERVRRFKFLGRLLERSDNDYPEILQNIRKARQVWGRLGKILWREGADPTVLEKLYCVVVQVVLLFGEETWVLMDTIS